MKKQVFLVLTVLSILLFTACNSLSKEEIISEVEENAKEVHSYKVEVDFEDEYPRDEEVEKSSSKMEAFIDLKANQGFVDHTNQHGTLYQYYFEGDDVYSDQRGRGNWLLEDDWTEEVVHTIARSDYNAILNYYLPIIKEQGNVDMEHKENSYIISYSGGDEEGAELLKLYEGRGLEEDTDKAIEMILEIDENTMFIQSFQFRLEEELGEGTMVFQEHRIFSEINEIENIEVPEGVVSY